MQGGSYGHKRFAADLDQPLSDKVAFRLNGMYENSDSFRDGRRPRALRRQPHADLRRQQPHHDHARLRAPPRHARGRPRHHVVPGPAGRRRPSPRSTATPTTATCAPASTSARPPSSTRRAASPSATARCSATTTASTRTTCPARSRADKTPGRAHRLQQRHAARRTSSTRPTSIWTPWRPAASSHTLLAGAEVGRQITDNFRNTGFFNDTATTHLGALRRPRPSARRSPSARAPPTPTTTCRRTWPPPTSRTRSSSRRKLQVVGGLRFDRFDLEYHNNRNGDTPRPRGRPRLAARRASSSSRSTPALGLRQLQRVLPAELRRPVLLADHDHRAGRAGEVHQLRGGREVGRRARTSR